MSDTLINYTFDVSGLDIDNTVVRCATQDEANIFLDYLCSQGVRDKENLRRLKECWEEHGSATCYHLSKRRWCYDSWYRENYPEICIVDFGDIYVGANCAEEYNVACSYDDLFA